MKALVYTRALELELLDVPDPEPAADELVVEVHRVGICGSEIEGVRSRSPFRVPPLVMGHELAGTLQSSGEPVVVNPVLSCHSCDQCLRGQTNLCRTRGIIGVHRAGGFAERVAVPRANVYRLPPNMSFEQAGLVEPLANGIHAWRLVADLAPSRVAVIGAGTVGLVALRVATWRGAARLEIVDISPDRLEVARSLGASAVGSELEGEFDVVFDAVGAPATRRSAVAHVRPGGAAVWLGLHADESTISGLDVVRSEKRIVGAFACTDADFRQALDLAVLTEPSFVSTFPLTEGAAVFCSLLEGRTDIVKAQLVPVSTAAAR